VSVIRTSTKVSNTVYKTQPKHQSKKFRSLVLFILSNVICSEESNSLHFVPYLQQVSSNLDNYLTPSSSQQYRSIFNHRDVIGLLVGCARFNVPLDTFLGHFGDSGVTAASARIIAAASAKASPPAQPHSVCGVE